jgi:hypothetical protein
LRLLRGSARDLAPVVLVIAAFQVLVVRAPLPADVEVLDLVYGLVLVLIGLTLFVQGLELGLFPVGEALASAFAEKGAVVALLGFSFALGFGTTVAEPALIAVADEASQVVAQGGLISDEPNARGRFAGELRLVVAIAVGAAVVLGVIRILLGWSLPMLVIGGYALVLGLTVIAPSAIVGIAYDSGGVTTSTITVPLLTALGVGLARTIRGRNPMLDGFGLIAFASLTPMVFVLGYGILFIGEGPQ